MSEQPPEPTPEELQAAIEAELRRIRVGDVLVQTIVTLVNLAARRLGLAQGSEEEFDLDQARDAIDAVRAIMPIAQRSGAAELGPIEEALTQLQMAYAQAAKAGGARPAEGAEPAEGPGEGGAGPAQSSGRLWVPGQ
jgi:hypothetical protein